MEKSKTIGNSIKKMQAIETESFIQLIGNYKFN